MRSDDLRADSWRESRSEPTSTKPARASTFADAALTAPLAVTRS
jgi:hypothetical protein